MTNFNHHELDRSQRSVSTVALGQHLFDCAYGGLYEYQQSGSTPTDSSNRSANRDQTRPSEKPPNYEIHSVLPGQSLFSIAKDHLKRNSVMSLEPSKRDIANYVVAIADANAMQWDTRLQVGQQLKLPYEVNRARSRSNSDDVSYTKPPDVWRRTTSQGEMEIILWTDGSFIARDEQRRIVFERSSREAETYRDYKEDVVYVRRGDAIDVIRGLDMTTITGLEHTARYDKIMDQQLEALGIAQKQRELARRKK